MFQTWQDHGNALPACMHVLLFLSNGCLLWCVVGFLVALCGLDGSGVIVLMCVNLCVLFHKLCMMHVYLINP